MNTQRDKKNELMQLLIGTGYLLFICLAFSLCLLLFTNIYNQQKTTASPVNPFTTGLPPAIPTPHILPTVQQNATVLFKDNFSDDSHGWEDGDDSDKTQITLGKLLLESFDGEYFASAECGLCPTLKSPFYLQADLSTGKETDDDDYGIYFNYNEDDFFLFTIDSKEGRYYLYQNSNDVWTFLVSGKSKWIKPYPATNTVGIYANGDLVEFYVNENFIDSYQQSGHSFHEGNFGFYTSEPGFQLIADNLLITKAGDH